MESFPQSMNQLNYIDAAHLDICKNNMWFISFAHGNRFLTGKAGEYFTDAGMVQLNEFFVQPFTDIVLIINN